MTCIRCPHCRGNDPSSAAQIVAGEIGPESAPLLFKAWLDLIDRISDEWAVRGVLAARTAAAVGCAPHTADNLLAEAAKLGILESTIHPHGSRRRAWVRWAPAPVEQDLSA